MVLTLKILAIIMICVAIIFLAHPASLKKFLNYVLQGSNIFFAAVIRLVVGAFMLLTASKCDIPIIIVVIGIIALASGILVFLLGSEKSKKIIENIVAKSELVHRVIAVIAIIIWGIIVYAA